MDHYDYYCKLRRWNGNYKRPKEIHPALRNFHTKSLWRAHLEHSTEMGAFILLTNKYCLVPPSSTKNFNREEIQDIIPIVTSTIAGCRILGRLSVGNSRGLVLPNSVTSTEFKLLRNSLSDEIHIKSVVDDPLSALGNIVACNDKIALVHPKIQPESEEIIADTLGVEVVRLKIGDYSLIGACCKFNVNGGVVHEDATDEDVEELANLVQVPFMRGTVNQGAKCIGGGVAVNDFWGVIGWKSTVMEHGLMESVFGLDGSAISIL